MVVRVGVSGMDVAGMSVTGLVMLMCHVHPNEITFAEKVSRARAPEPAKMVGAPRFELGTSCAQGRRATRLRYAPTERSSL